MRDKTGRDTVVDLPAMTGHARHEMSSAFHIVGLLLVQDDPGDLHLTREAFAAARVNNPLNVVSDGEPALAFLRREGRYAGAPRPGLVLTDLYLPQAR